MPSSSLTRLSTALWCLCCPLILGWTPAGADINRDSPSELPAGIEIGLSYDAEGWRAAGNGRYLDLLSVEVAVDGATLLHAPGLSLYASALYSNGSELNDPLFGALEGISNIETTRAVRLYESWAEWQYGNSQHSLKLGLYDLNSEFDAIDTAGLFINPSHGIGADFSQSGQNGPSIFPTTSLAIRSAHGYGPWRLQLAVLDGVPGDPDHGNNTTIRINADEGMLAVMEAGYVASRGRVAAGYWQYSAQFADLQTTDSQGDPLLRRGNRGWYAFADLPLWTQQNDQRALNVFMRYGQANSRVNIFKSYLGLGAAYTGLLAPARGDRLGLALSVASAGKPYRLLQADAGNSVANKESIVELTYLLPLTAWFIMQPDVQYVRNPGLRQTSNSAWAFGLRLTLDYGWQR